MTLIGERVRLRAIEPEDADAFWRWHHDEHAMRWMGTSYPESRAQLRKRFADFAPNSYERCRFAIETTAESRLVGYIALRDAHPESGRAELDIYLGDPDTWNKGYATEALRLMCHWGFEDMRLHAIQLSVVVDNEAAIHLYRKLGFVEEGRLREVHRRDGRLHDMYVMSLLATEFAASTG
ncbi:GNAT family N-acetyltransferase [Actinokineospora globicatena]|uniref:GNAT family N-acetyltransferase n=1 Tax=Actinokineospora globicatena TaxID=103729 RepID=UPI0020A2A6F6|nr:GNAT family N-acetyltransferase [Actinokineospora globicatena]MCP2300556.1 Protein N-acetyltransferase, RimJ/RimL family [Actinokineospora globicatena]GLW81100.1 N-acetyltransferase [Actinokineospora globicatena]GLW88293.1 N-acetyltransferase [Actinokineospora globicatena]